MSRSRRRPEKKWWGAVKLPTEQPIESNMNTAKKRDVMPGPMIYVVRLEADAEALSTHDIFVEVEAEEETRRAAMVEQLKERVRAGTYQPNLDLIAERILEG